jgi:HIV Tat-specific factor 1
VKKAWFPRVDDDFLAIYQMNYGFVDNTGEGAAGEEKKALPQQEPSEVESVATSSSALSSEETTLGKKRKAQAPPPKWFEVAPEQNTKVYVSNLPGDITEDEFGQLMSKCGLVMKDLKTGKLKVKLYRDASGQVKGDGLCHFIKVSEKILFNPSAYPF